MLLSSYVFYAWWDWRFLILLAFSSAVDFLVGMKIEDAASSSAKKRWLWVSLFTNLGILCTFKYFNFFAQSLAQALSWVGVTPHWATINVLLPVGVSFYTFQELSYVFDVYRGNFKASRDPINFFLFVSYFPHMVAGPIQRADKLLTQLQKERVVTAQAIINGISLFAIGLFKKLVLADLAAGYVDQTWSRLGDASPADVVMAFYLFSIQIYGDFSGYSDMAKGMSCFFGIDLMENFKQPYFASSITDFWRRWHISLSTWLRDYLYIPLGGNRGSPLRTYFNLLTTMFIGGLWHGANWTFVIWGTLHGIYLSVHKLWLTLSGKSEGASPSSIFSRLLSMIFTFHLVTFTWVFFRAPDLSTAMLFLRRLSEWNLSYELDWAPLSIAFVALWLVDMADFLESKQLTIMRAPSPVRFAYFGTLLGLIFLLSQPGETPFIYFQF